MIEQKLILKRETKTDLLIIPGKDSYLIYTGLQSSVCCQWTIYEITPYKFKGEEEKPEIIPRYLADKKQPRDHRFYKIRRYRKRKVKVFVSAPTMDYSTPNEIVCNPDKYYIVRAKPVNRKHGLCGLSFWDLPRS